MRYLFIKSILNNVFLVVTYEGQIKYCLMGLMSIQEAKEVCKSREKWRSIISAYLARTMAWWYVCMYVLLVIKRATYATFVGL